MSLGFSAQSCHPFKNIFIYLFWLRGVLLPAQIVHCGAMRNWNLKLKNNTTIYSSVCTHTHKEYLGITLTKYVQVLYVKNYKTLMKSK